MSSEPNPASDTRAKAAADTSAKTSGAFSPARVIYGVYAWIAFIVCALPALFCALVLPGLERRRRWISRFARAPFWLAGISTRVSGLENLPVGHCVVVANHASYVDGVVLQAFLPPRFSYVIKGEAQNVPVVGFLLRRVGAHFVDRFSAGGSARDARNLLRAAGGGDSLAFFPEGTFTPRVGLAAFRSGAFVAAIRADVPLVPVVIRGSRQILRPESVLPDRAELLIDILEPLNPASTDDARQLAELARQKILAVLDEPDLVAGEAPAAGT